MSRHIPYMVAISTSPIYPFLSLRSDGFSEAHKKGR